MKERHEKAGGRSTGLNRRTIVAGLGAGLAGIAAPALHTRARAQEAVTLPDYYPSSYMEIVEGSRKEGGTLNVYSNISDSNWRYVLAAFKRKFPWVANLKTNNLGTGEVFQRFYNENATGAHVADIVFNNTPRHWVDFVSKRKLALDYKSPESSKLPAWSLQLPGLYHLASEPVVLGYNKMLLPEDKRPRSIAHLAQLISENKSLFARKVTTFAIDEAIGFDINWKYVTDTEGAWSKLEQILPSVRPENSSGPSVEKLLTGEYVAGFFLSGPILWARIKNAAQVVGWNFIEDGNPVFLRAMAIPEKAKNVNTAKLFLDFCLSHEGQVAASQGSMVPYRADVTAEQSQLSYQRLGASLGGEKNIILMDYDNLPTLAQEDEFRARWKKALAL